jgi:hypothetical protein
MIVVEGTSTFRRVCLLVSVIFSGVTVFILMMDPSECKTADLRFALWLCFSVQLSTFMLLLFHFIGLGFCLRKLGRGLGLYYFFMVGAMIWTQIIFFKSKGCYMNAPAMYFWLVMQIMVFYIFVAYGI